MPAAGLSVGIPVLRAFQGKSPLSQQPQPQTYENALEATSTVDLRGLESSEWRGSLEGLFVSSNQCRFFAYFNNTLCGQGLLTG